jgi:hypothetical protein
MKQYKLKKIEDKIYLLVVELYGISKEELEGFKELMNILSGKYFDYKNFSFCNSYFHIFSFF